MTIEAAFFNGSALLSPALEADVRAGIGEAISAFQCHTDLGQIEIAAHLSELVGRETGLGGYA